MVCSFVRGVIGLVGSSKLLGGARHLECILMQLTCLGYHEWSIRRAPSLYNTCKQALFWIVGDVWTKSKDRTPKISVVAFDFDRFHHRIAYRFEDAYQCRMKELSAVLAVFISTPVLLFCYRRHKSHTKTVAINTTFWYG